jgi:hypothetical protein
MGFETGRAAAARKWIVPTQADSAGQRAFIDAFPRAHFYRGGSDDNLAAKADVLLPDWYRRQRKSLIGLYIEEPGAVWDARFRFARCDFPTRHADHFHAPSDRDWFVLTHFGYGGEEERRQLYGACGLLPIGVRFGYHLHLAISLRKPSDRRIFVVHLDEVGAAPQPAFLTYASMLSCIVEVRKGAGGEILRAE